MFESEDTTSPAKLESREDLHLSGSSSPSSVSAGEKEGLAPATDAIVDEWFAKHFHGLGARLDEFLFAHLRAAKEDLKLLLARGNDVT